jgi:hypothetical protein
MAYSRIKKWLVSNKSLVEIYCIGTLTLVISASQVFIAVIQYRSTATKNRYEELSTYPNVSITRSTEDGYDVIQIFNHGGAINHPRASTLSFVSLQVNTAPIPTTITYFVPQLYGRFEYTGKSSDLVLRSVSPHTFDELESRSLGFATTQAEKGLSSSYTFWSVIKLEYQDMYGGNHTPRCQDSCRVSGVG